MSLEYLKQAVREGDSEKLIRYVRLHLGDGDEATGKKEIDKAWIEALKLLLDVPETKREFILEILAEKDAATLAHFFLSPAFLFCPAFGRMDSRWRNLTKRINYVPVYGQRSTNPTRAR